MFPKQITLSRKHLTGLGALAMAKNRSSARPKDEPSGLRLRAGRVAFAFGTKALPALRLTHLGRLCGRPLFLALTFWLLLGQAKSNKKNKT